ncbi:putative disease resistance protein isoform X1 [Cinnamomum micranthum f. kanehirae]|uniref:Putative disease resistance protein isoform X1 n=1 Tax=Cinnamomum micranthum f. kanehirae TaxID=337451 RepID=A0A3S3PD13_9MAGN|nr:putative disease resistance protein isoform X1 [Cinnamomum micranthum f. kanehirae]
MAIQITREDGPKSIINAEVSSLSKLDQLRLLDLSETSIQELPAGMKAMVKLQHLNLNWTRESHLFPAGIISELSRVEELTMY